jgi:hypothetical protein
MIGARTISPNGERRTPRAWRLLTAVLGLVGMVTTLILGVRNFFETFPWQTKGGILYYGYLKLYILDGLEGALTGLLLGLAAFGYAKFVSGRFSGSRLVLALDYGVLVVLTLLIAVVDFFYVYTLLYPDWFKLH